MDLSGSKALLNQAKDYYEMAKLMVKDENGVPI